MNNTNLNYRTPEELKNPLRISAVRKLAYGDYDCVYRINELLTIFEDFLKKGKSAKENDVKKAIDAANDLTLFMKENTQCLQYISDDKADIVEKVLDLAISLGYKIDGSNETKGGRRKASPKYKRTRRRMAKSKRTRRR